jgi:phospholipid N-methyltransferase
MSTLAFFKESIRNLRTTGAVVRSSKYLVKEMLKPIDFDKAKVIVELGAGDGAMTEVMLNSMKPDSMLLCFEINPQFCEILRGITDPRFKLIEDSAENLNKHLVRLNLDSVDYVISAIPFVALPDALANNIVKKCHKALKINGLFVQFHYTPLIGKKYERIFGNIDINFVARNLPPAFVMVCEKK